MKVALINHVGAQHNKEMELIAEAGQKYSDLVCAAHGLAPIPVTFFPGALTAPPGYAPLGAFSTPDVAGALGYHDVDSQGRPYGKAFLSLVPKGEMLHDVSGTGQSLAGVLTHELAEMIKDSLANAWRQMRIVDPSTKRVYSLGAEELCDWVQNFAFTLPAKDGTKVDCSDFVYPEFFDSATPKGTQLSYMHVVHTPGEVAKGCYGIVANEVNEGQVFARVKAAFAKPKSPVRIFHETEKPPAWREALQGHPAGRTTRRCK